MFTSETTELSRDTHVYARYSGRALSRAMSLIGPAKSLGRPLTDELPGCARSLSGYAAERYLQNYPGPAGMKH